MSSNYIGNQRGNGLPARAAVSDEARRAEDAAFLRKVYAYMTAGLGATGVVAMLVASSEAALRVVLQRPLFTALVIGEILMVMAFAWLAPRMRAVGAAALFFVYALMNGLTLSVIFVAYTKSSIATAFFVTAGTFAGMSVYGFATKRDLSSMGSFLFMGLWGLILAGAVNLWLRSPMVTWVTTCAGVLVFVGLTAYDTQKIKQLNVIGNAGTDEDHKEAIHGALTLYLDFVNLFLYILRLFGRRR